MADKKIEIVVMSGVVAEVNNLPKGYTYKITDLDEIHKKNKPRLKIEDNSKKYLDKKDTMVWTSKEYLK